MLKKTLFINETEKRVVADPETTLASFLRKQMFLTGTKSGCGKGECGACTVILDGRAVRSCTVKMKEVPDDARIVTIEGIGTGESLHPLQLAWIIHGTAQCGFCTPGFIVSARALLDQNADPTGEEVREWFRNNRNVCRCGGEESAADAVLDAAKLIRGEVTKEELWSKLKDKAKMVSGKADPEAVAKVTGTWAFGSDLGLNLPEGALYMKLVQAQVSSANILSIETGEAEKMPGVFKVLTWKDVPGTNRLNGSGQILSDRKITRSGDTVAAVLAYRPKLAEEAAKKVKVKLEKLSEGIAAEEEGDISLEPEVGFAYLNDKGRLIIHTKNTDASLRELAEGIGVSAEKLALAPNPTVGTEGKKPTAPLEGLLGVAALVAKKPVYLEL